MAMDTYHAIPCEVTLLHAALDYVPEAMREHVRAGGKLWLVERPVNGRAFISVAEDPCGKICTFVSETDVACTTHGEDGDGRDMGFVKPDAIVWYVRPECVEFPVRQGEVMAVYPEDSYAELWDGDLCDVTADFDMIFATREEAEAAEKALSC